MKKYPQKEREAIVKDYVRSGYSLIRLNGKIPLIKDWPKTPYNPALSLSDLGGGNFGVVLKDDDLVIDVDPRNFKNGINSFKSLMRDAKLKEFDTFIVQTGGGGLHIYLEKDSNLQYPSKLKKYPGIEFKSKGTQIVGATCIHPDTKRPYEILEQPITLKNVDEVLKWKD